MVRKFFPGVPFVPLVLFHLFHSILGFTNTLTWTTEVQKKVPNVIAISQIGPRELALSHTSQGEIYVPFWFRISESVVMRYITMWVCFLYHHLKVVELSTSIDEIVLPQDILEQVEVFIYNFSIWSLSSGTNKLITFPKWCLFQKYDHHASLHIQGCTYQHFCSFFYGPCKCYDSLVSERVSGKQPCVPNTEQVLLPLLHLRPLKVQD